MAKMLCRAALAAIAISCTFSSLSIAQLHDKGTRGALKDLICVLFLSGIQKEDLDVSLLQKLKRYDSNLGDWNDKKLAKECLNITVRGPKENNGKNTVSTDTNTPKPKENTITELETELNTAIQRLKDESRLPVDFTYQYKKSTEVNTESQTVTPIQYKAMDNNDVKFWENFMLYYNNKNNITIRSSSTSEPNKQAVNQSESMVTRATATNKNKTYTKINRRVSQLEEKSNNKSDYSADVELINKIITKFLKKTQTTTVLTNDSNANVTTTEIPETTEVSHKNDLELHLVSNIAAIEKLNENLEILKRNIIEHHYSSNFTMPNEQAIMFINKSVDRLDNPINLSQSQNVPILQNINGASDLHKQKIPNTSTQNYHKVPEMFKRKHQSFLLPFQNLRELFKTRNIWRPNPVDVLPFSQNVNAQLNTELDKSDNNEKTELFHSPQLILGSSVPQNMVNLNPHSSTETPYKSNLGSYKNSLDIEYSQRKSDTDQTSGNSGDEMSKPESHILKSFVKKVLLSELLHLKQDISIPRILERPSSSEKSTGFLYNDKISNFARRISDDNTKEQGGVPEPITLASITSKDDTHFQNGFDIQSSINKVTNANQPLNNDAMKVIAENVKEIILKDLRKTLNKPVTSTPKPVTNKSSKNVSTTKTYSTKYTSTTPTSLVTTTKNTPKTTTTEKKTTSKTTYTTASPVSQITEESTSFSKMINDSKAIEKFIELFEKLKPTAAQLQTLLAENNITQKDVKPPSMPVTIPPGLENLFSKPPPTSQPLSETTKMELHNSSETSLQINPILSQMKPPAMLQFGSSILLSTVPAPQPQVTPTLKPPSNNFQYDTAPFMLEQFGSPQMMKGPLQFPNIGGVNIMIPIEPIQKSQQPGIIIQTDANEIRPLGIPVDKPVPVNVLLVTKGPYLNDDRRERWNIMVNYEKRISSIDKQINLNDTKANHNLPKQANTSISTINTNDTDIRNTSLIQLIQNNDKIEQVRNQNKDNIQSELNFYKSRYNEFISKFKNKTHNDIVEKYLNDPEWNTSSKDSIHRTIKEPIAKEIIEGIPLEISDINIKEPNIYSKLEFRDPTGTSTEKNIQPGLMSEFIKFRVGELHLNKNQEELLSQKLFTNPEIVREIINNKQERDSLFNELVKNRNRIKENFYMNPINTNHNLSFYRNPINPFYSNHQALQTSLESEFRNYLKNNRELIERNSLLHNGGENEEKHNEQNRQPGTLELHKGIFPLKTRDETSPKFSSDTDQGLKGIEDGKLGNHHSWHLNRDHVYVNPYKEFIEKSRLKLKYQEEPINRRAGANIWHSNKYRRDPVEAISELTNDYNKLRFVSDSNRLKRIRTLSETTDVETKQRTSDSNNEANFSDLDSWRRAKLKGFHHKLEGTDGWTDTHDEDSFLKRHQKPLSHNKNHDDTNFKNFLKTQDKVNKMLEKILATKVDGMQSVENI